jgi:hypothetical protein
MSRLQVNPVPADSSQYVPAQDDPSGVRQSEAEQAVGQSHSGTVNIIDRAGQLYRSRTPLFIKGMLIHLSAKHKEQKEAHARLFAMLGELNLLFNRSRPMFRRVDRNALNAYRDAVKNLLRAAGVSEEKLSEPGFERTLASFDQTLVAMRNCISTHEYVYNRCERLGLLCIPIGQALALSNDTRIAYRFDRATPLSAEFKRAFEMLEALIAELTNGVNGREEVEARAASA